MITQKRPELKPLLNTCMFSVNLEYVESTDHLVYDSDEIALIPPVSGG